MLKALFSLFLLFNFVTVSSWASPPQKGNHHHKKSRSTASLQKYMADFGSWFAGMEIMRVKDKKTDWEAIDESVDKIMSSLKSLQLEDKKKLYIPFTDQLESDFKELKKHSSKKSKKFFKTLDRMSQTCFRCHAQNRPQDFLFRADNK